MHDLYSIKHPTIRWLEQDVRNMTDIPSACIDIAIDKGTLDAMISGSLWDPPDVVRINTKKYIDEVCPHKPQTQNLIFGSLC